MTERDDSSVLQDDLAELLDALGLPISARAESPHVVFRSAIEEVKRRKLLRSLISMPGTKLYGMNAQIFAAIRSAKVAKSTVTPIHPSTLCAFIEHLQGIDRAPIQVMPPWYYQGCQYGEPE